MPNNYQRPQTRAMKGAFVATALFRWLIPSLPKDADSVLVPNRVISYE
jgi:hypothetical protein